MIRCILMASTIVSFAACSTEPASQDRALVDEPVALEREHSLLRDGYMSVAPGDSIRFTVTPVRLSRLVRFLADAKVVEPDSAIDGMPIDPDVRLHAVASEGPCVEGTHFVCYHDYLLTVRTDWTEAYPRAFELGQVGEISDFRWMSREAEVYRLTMLASNWPSWVLEARQGHVLVRDSIVLAFNADSFWVESRTRLP